MKEAAGTKVGWRGQNDKIYVNYDEVGSSGCYYMRAGSLEFQFIILSSLSLRLTGILPHGYPLKTLNWTLGQRSSLVLDLVIFT